MDERLRVIRTDSEATQVYAKLDGAAAQEEIAALLAAPVALLDGLEDDEEDEDDDRPLWQKRLDAEAPTAATASARPASPRSRNGEWTPPGASSTLQRAHPRDKRASIAHWPGAVVAAGNAPPPPPTPARTEPERQSSVKRSAFVPPPPHHRARPAP